MHNLGICISGGIFGAARQTIILNTFSSPLKICCLFFHCAIRRRLHVQVILNFVGRHFYITELLDNCFDLKFLHFENVIHPPLLKVLWSFVGSQGFTFAPLFSFLLLSPFLCFMSLLHLDVYVLGDDALITYGSFMQTKYLCVLIQI